MPQVFLSYSTADSKFAEKLASDLRDSGIIVWKAPDSILPGEGWIEAITRGLKTSSQLVLIKSPNSVASYWVNFEFDIALMRRSKNKITIIPVHYETIEEDDEPDTWAVIQHVDMLTDYEGGFRKLINRIYHDQPAKPPPPADPLSTVINLHVEGDVSGVIEIAARDIIKSGPDAGRPVPPSSETTLPVSKPPQAPISSEKTKLPASAKRSDLPAATLVTSSRMLNPTPFGKQPSIQKPVYGGPIAQWEPLVSISVSGDTEFNPMPRERLVIRGTECVVQQHPSVPTLAYRKETRRSSDYQLKSDSGWYRLIKYKAPYRDPDKPQYSEAIFQFAELPGLEICDQICIHQPTDTSLVKLYPDLEYSVLTRWLIGLTWQDIIEDGTILNRLESLTCAKATVELLNIMEGEGIAHCDIAGSNILLNFNAATAHLFTVEHLYAPQLPAPHIAPVGSAGYSHQKATKGIWNAFADRFAGAVLLSEMLAWHNEEVRIASKELHYFSYSEMQAKTDRYLLIRKVLNSINTKFTELLEQAWFSKTLEDCPPLSQWAEVIREAHHAETLLNPAPEWRSLAIPSSPVNGTPLSRPVLDLSHIDGRNRPFLVWTETPNASGYLLQEADNPDYNSVKEFKTNAQQTKWNPQWGRSGRLYYRVRALVGKSVTPWSDTLSIRIGGR